jgi:site-specific recombinase XerD
VKKLGCRLGNWLTAEQARVLWQLLDPDTLKGKRDRAILAVLLGCGLRRRELTELTTEHFLRRENHWTIVDLIGKGGHVRTIPVPTWVKQTVDDWLVAARVADGRLFRQVCRAEFLWTENGAFIGSQTLPILAIRFRLNPASTKNGMAWRRLL